MITGMSFSWEPFGRTYREAPQAEPEPTAPTPPAAPAPAPAALRREPRLSLAVLTCMDCRIDPLDALGLTLGDAVVLRNAGAQASDDVVRSLRLAQDGLGVRTVHVIGHTDCAAHGGDDEVAEAAAADSAERIEANLPNLRVEYGLLDLTTGTVR
jgi:carbonic anhydrase